MASFQRIDALAESPAELDQQTVGLGKSAEGLSTWMTTDEAATHLRYRGKSRLRSVYRFIQTKGIPVRRRGLRSILVARADLDRALKGK